MGHNIKWDHFDILANGRSDLHSKETLLIRELQPTLNENLGSKKLFLYWLGFVLFCRFQTEVCLLLILSVFLIRYQSFTLRLNLFVNFRRSLLKMYVVAYETLSS